LINIKAECCIKR